MFVSALRMIIDSRKMFDGLKISWLGNITYFTLFLHNKVKQNEITGFAWSRFPKNNPAFSTTLTGHVIDHCRLWNTLRYQHTFTTLHGVISEEATRFILTTLRIWNLK